MKNIYYITLITIVVIVISSCSSDYLDQIPTDNIDEQEVIATTENLYVALNGIHRMLYLRYETQSQGGLAGMMIQLDALGEDVVMTSTGNGWYNGDYQWRIHTNASSSGNEFPYRVLYRINRNANSIINNVDTALGSQEDKNMLKGQALVYRAFCHFQLVQLYAKRYEPGNANTQLGVAIALINSIEKVTRSTVEEVYQQINTDLDQAIELLENYRRPNKSHLNQNVAKGLKARVALVQGNWTIAAQMAQEARVGYPLMDTISYRSGFNNYNNAEWLWGSHVVIDQTLYFANFGAYMSRNYNSSNIRTNPKAINSRLYNQIPSTDVRSTIFDPTGEHLNLPSGYAILAAFGKSPYTSQKFLAVSASDSRMDLPYMRAAEMFLIEAEAKAQLGSAEATAILFDFVKSRDLAYEESTKNGQDLIDEIHIQRRIELWGEGFRFLDLKRTNAPLDRTGANHSNALTGEIMNIAPGDNRWQWLIPQNEINANPLIIQNPI